MMQLNNTGIPRKGQHLTLKERIEIQTMKRQGASNRLIAKKLGRSHATINNEIKRGTTSQVQLVNHKKVYTELYFAETGQANYDKHRKDSVKPFKLSRLDAFLTFAAEKIKQDNWSPDAVVGYVRANALFSKEEHLCTRSLYRYIDEGLVIDVSNMDLLLKLRRNTRKQRTRANKRILGKSIEERPDDVNQRVEFGHWEIDTVIGSKNKEEPVLLTLTERLTRYEIIIKIGGKNDKAVYQAMSELADLPKAAKLFKTITADNGSEFTSLDACMKEISDVYFTHPYSSWERGTNEHHNGIIRRFIPKGSLLSKIGDRTLLRVSRWMNNLPRKILNYQTPVQRFNHYYEQITA